MAKLIFKNDDGYVLTDRNAEFLLYLEGLRNGLEEVEEIYGLPIVIKAKLTENYEKTQWINCEIKCDIDSKSYLYVNFDNFPKSDFDMYNNSNVFAGQSCLSEDACFNLNELAILMSIVNVFTKWRKIVRGFDNE